MVLHATTPKPFLQLSRALVSHRCSRELQMCENLLLNNTIVPTLSPFGSIAISPGN